MVEEQDPLWADWHTMAQKDQDSLTQFACSFCFQHKGDNMAKAVKTYLINHMNRRHNFNCSAT